MANKTHVLISYSREDNHSTGYHIRLRDYLQNQLGIASWIDLEVPGGAPWVNIIDDQLEMATHLVLIWSPKAAFSRYVSYEWSVAFLRGIPIIPIQSPDFPTLKPSDIPPVLSDLNFLNDPIEISEDQAKLLKRILEDTTESKPHLHSDLPIQIIRDLRRADPAASEALYTWTLGCADLKTLRIVEQLITNTLPLQQTDPNRRFFADVLHQLSSHIEGVELRISHESEIKLRQHLREIAHELKGKVAPEVIQRMVKGYVEAWSLAQFGTPKPPPPNLSPRDYFIEQKRKCGLCTLKVTTDNRGCCTDCGLFYSWWEEAVNDDEN